MNNRVNFKKSENKIDNSQNINIGNISNNIEKATNKDDSEPLSQEYWYKRPVGIIFLGIIVTVVGKYILYELGM